MDCLHTLEALISKWQERANKERLIAKRDPGSITSAKAVATSLAYDSAATELDECIHIFINGGLHDLHTRN